MTMPEGEQSGGYVEPQSIDDVACVPLSVASGEQSDTSSDGSESEDEEDEEQKGSGDEVPHSKDGGDDHDHSGAGGASSAAASVAMGSDENPDDHVPPIPTHIIEKLNKMNTIEELKQFANETKRDAMLFVHI